MSDDLLLLLLGGAWFVAKAVTVYFGEEDPR